MAEENKTAAVVPPAEEKEKTVPVSEKVLKDILAKMETYQTEISGLKEAQKEWESTASQDQIAKIEKLRASGKLVKSIRLNYYDNKLVLSWRSSADDVYIDNTGKEVSVQKTKVTFDGVKDEVELAQIDFARRKMQREYEVIEEGRDRDGNMVYTVTIEGGKEIKIDGRYIN